MSGYAVRNSAELTLEYRESNILEGLVTALRPRKRANISQSRIACMTWRFHCGICTHFVISIWLSGETRQGTAVYIFTYPLQLLPRVLVQLVAPQTVFLGVEVLRRHGRHRPAQHLLAGRLEAAAVDDRVELVEHPPVRLDVAGHRREDLSGELLAGEEPDTQHAAAGHREVQRGQQATCASTAARTDFPKASAELSEHVEAGCAAHECLVRVGHVQEVLFLPV